MPHTIYNRKYKDKQVTGMSNGEIIIKDLQDTTKEPHTKKVGDTLLSVKIRDGVIHAQTSETKIVKLRVDDLSYVGIELISPAIEDIDL